MVKPTVEENGHYGLGDLCNKESREPTDRLPFLLWFDIIFSFLLLLLLLTKFAVFIKMCEIKKNTPQPAFYLFYILSSLPSLCLHPVSLMYCVLLCDSHDKFVAVGLDL